jgi:hypothetical protein
MALIEDHHRTLFTCKLFTYDCDSLLCIFAGAEGFFESLHHNTINPFGDDAIALASFHFSVAVPDGVGFGDVHGFVSLLSCATAAFHRALVASKALRKASFCSGVLCMIVSFQFDATEYTSACSTMTVSLLAP